VHKNGTELGRGESEWHLFKIPPVLRPKPGDGFKVTFFKKFFLAGMAIFEEAKFVVAEQGDRGVLPRQLDDAIAVWSTIDQIAKQHDAIMARELEASEEFGEFEMASVNIADGDESALHAEGKC